MYKQTRRVRDAFTFSLGGIRTISSFVTTPTVADNRINQAIAARLSQAENACQNHLHDEAERKPQWWFRRPRPTALSECA